MIQIGRRMDKDVDEFDGGRQKINAIHFFVVRWMTKKVDERLEAVLLAGVGLEASEAVQHQIMLCPILIQPVQDAGQHVQSKSFCP